MALLYVEPKKQKSYEPEKEIVEWWLSVVWKKIK